MSRTIMLSVCMVVCIAFMASVVSSDELKRVAPEKVGLSSERLERIGALMQRTIDNGRIAGTVSMVVRHGKIAYLESHGMMDIEKGMPMREDTIFRICSMTKPITSVAVMMLYEEGHFLLSDPVSNYIPEFKEMTILKKTESGKTYRIPATKQITIRHLLTHSSGLTYHGSNKDLGAMYYDAGVSHGLMPDTKTIGEGMKILATLPLLFEPGERYEYGLSYDVLGYLVEVISGMTFDEFLRISIFEPLGMVDTHFFLPEDKVSRLASVYDYDREKGLNHITADYPYKGTKSYFSGGGGLCSTTHDYARFCQMLLNEGELDGFRLLGPKTIRFMRSVHQKTGNPEYDYGLGFGVWGIDKPLQELTSPGRYGWGGYYSTHPFIDPMEDMFGIFMSQHPLKVAKKFAKRFEVMAFQAIIE